MARFVLISALITSATSVALGQETRTLSGTVIDRDRRLVSGALIQVSGTNVGARSDTLGRFTLAIPGADTFTLRLRAIGYLPKVFSFRLRADSSVFLMLESLRIPVDTTPLPSGVLIALAYARAQPRIGGVDTIGIALASAQVFACRLGLHVVQTRDSNHTYLNVVGTVQEVCPASTGRAMWSSHLVLAAEQHELAVVVRDRVDRFLIQRRRESICVQRLGSRSATELLARTQSAVAHVQQDPLPFRSEQRLSRCR